jgi:hypothetical protein
VRVADEGVVCVIGSSRLLWLGRPFLQASWRAMRCSVFGKEAVR